MKKFFYVALALTLIAFPIYLLLKKSGFELDDIKYDNTDYISDESL